MSNTDSKEPSISVWSAPYMLGAGAALAIYVWSIGIEKVPNSKQMITGIIFSMTAGIAVSAMVYIKSQKSPKTTPESSEDTLQ